MSPVIFGIDSYTCILHFLTSVRPVKLFVFSDHHCRTFPTHANTIPCKTATRMHHTAAAYFRFYLRLLMTVCSFCFAFMKGHLKITLSQRPDKTERQNASADLPKTQAFKTMGVHGDRGAAFSVRADCSRAFRGVRAKRGAFN